MLGRENRTVAYIYTSLQVEVTSVSAYRENNRHCTSYVVCVLPLRHRLKVESPHKHNLKRHSERKERKGDVG